MHVLPAQAQAKVSADIVDIDSELVRCLLCYTLLATFFHVSSLCICVQAN